MLHLRRKDAPFAVIDSHAGRGAYDLAGAGAARTNEAANGIGKLSGIEADGGLGEYLWLARGRAQYPGSPLLAAQLLRPQDRLVAVEKHPEEFAALKTVLAPFRNARAEEADGYHRLTALLPPAERRGLIVIDPPFEAANEFQVLGQAIAAALRRFATGIYLVWYPHKSAPEVNALCGDALNAGARKALRIDLDLGAGGAPIGTKTPLTATGVLVINPPYGFADDMRAALATVAPRLSQTATFRIDWIAGEPD
ncbi:MAG: 23S rRNA (adenine(2030)-N(6))-methyltransferase RlmJ [Alphaproteobacteria bacterium]|nr:23S rRNA (adenine(2030)-N(6))-methyltransferase RlmJ [Alphaproteobacteria bacterium]MBV9903669.1 23S rRNA (adenine(2030)-N(6))-methyltransferase RlmJ [Alphaproteobacteria bacterium]